MKPNVEVKPAPRANRLLMVLAAAWMIASLAIGGTVTADLRADRLEAPAVTRTASQP